MKWFNNKIYRQKVRVKFLLYHQNFDMWIKKLKLLNEAKTNYLENKNFVLKTKRVGITNNIN